MLAAALLALHAAMLASLAGVLPWTVDERFWLHAGRYLRETGEYQPVQTWLHPPLVFLASQLGAWLGAPAGDLDAYRVVGRLGVIPFALATGALVFVLARRWFGPGAGLAALVLHVCNPAILSFAALVGTDLAVCSGVLLALWLAARWCEAPGWGRLLALGGGLGLALATKFTALLLVPALLVVLAVALARGLEPRLWWTLAGNARTRLRRAGDGVLAVVVVGALALLVLHAGYGFPGGYRPQEVEPHHAPRSAVFRALAGNEGLAALVRLLPAPFGRGLDVQVLQRESALPSALGEHLLATHPLHLPVALLLKLPVGFLLLLVAGLVLRRPALPRHAAVQCLSVAAAFGLALALVPPSGSGLRFALPIVPLLAVVAGRGVVALLGRGPLARASAVAGLLSLPAVAAWEWPAYESSFNVLAGTRPYLWVADQGFGWPGADGPGPWRDELERRHPDAERVHATGGPRLGLLRAFGRDLAPPDPRAPGRVHHWLRRFEPVARFGPWFVFRVDAGGFARRVGADPRGRTELAVALLGTAEPEQALPWLEGNPDPDVPRVRAAVAGLRAGRRDDAELGELLLALGRGDLVARMPEQPALLRARGCLQEGRPAEAVAALEAVAGARALAVPEALHLAFAWRELGALARAAEVLERHAPPPGTPEAEAFRRAGAELRSAEAGMRQLRLEGR